MSDSSPNILNEKETPTWSWAFTVFFVLVLFAFFMIYILVGSDYHAFWMRLFIKPMSIPHGDLQALVAAIQCMAQGIDPIVTNPCDVGGRGLLLPRTWLSFGFFGLSADNIHLWALFFIAQFGGALFLLFHAQKGKDLIWVGLLVFAPPVLLAVERVNSDLLTFGCLVAGAFLFAAPQRSQRWLSLTLIFFATALKLYPVVAGGMFFQGKSWRSLKRVLIFGLLCSFFFVIAWDDIQAIRSVDAQRHVYGVGHDMIWLHLAPLAEEWLTYDLLVGGWRLVEALILGFMAFWVIAARKILINLGTLIHHSSPACMNTFILGGSIYVALFILHSFYDYKLVITLMTLPLLLWVKNNSADSDQRYWAVGTLFLLVLLSWLGIYFWWTVYDQAAGIDLRTEPLLYYGSLLLRFGVSWGVFVGYVLGLMAIVYHRLDREASVNDTESTR